MGDRNGFLRDIRLAKSDIFLAHEERTFEPIISILTQIIHS